MTGCHTFQAFHPSGIKIPADSRSLIQTASVCRYSMRRPSGQHFVFILLSGPQCPENPCLPGRAKRELSPQPPLPRPEPRRRPGGPPHWAAPQYSCAFPTLTIPSFSRTFNKHFRQIKICKITSNQVQLFVSSA